MVLQLTLLAILAGTPAGASEASAVEIKQAVNRSLILMQKSLAEYPKHEKCFSCHHQGVSMLALSLARSRGYAVDEKGMDAVVRHTAADLRSEIEAYRAGKGQPGGVTRAGYALLALQSGGAKRDEITAAVTGFLLQRDTDKGYWRTSANRPPAEASNFTDTYLAIRALRSFSEEPQKEAAAKRIEGARLWMEKTPAKDTEDRVFRLWGLKEAGAEAAAKSEAKALLAEQREDGGWAQIPGAKSDAYATGSVLTVLCLAGGLSPHDQALQRGIRFLLDAQQPDGSWHVVSRSKPFQPYFETGYPHKLDQFISMAAGGWATAALVLGVEAPGLAQ